MAKTLTAQGVAGLPLLPRDTGSLCGSCGCRPREHAHVGLCAPCVNTAISAQAYNSVSRRTYAQRAHRRDYPDLCAIHGETAHDAKTGECGVCHPGNARMAAREAAEKTYIGTCSTHGETAFSTHRGRCLSCFNTLGARRPTGGTTSPRVLARQLGLPRFQAYCEQHGDTAHSVLHGKCLSCFNTNGQARAAARHERGDFRTKAQRREDDMLVSLAQLVDNDADRLSAARLYRTSTVLLTCPVHGEAIHRTRDGSCTACRPRPG